MARKGGDTRLKRQSAPTYWMIHRKEKRFVLNASPGPHQRLKSYPLGVILRDVLGKAASMREARNVLFQGKVKVDGKVRRDVNFPIGLMDVLELIPTRQIFRLVPKDSKLLHPVEISDHEKALKFTKISSKVTIRGGKLQYGFHDGKTMISDQSMSVGDTCLLNLEKMAIQDVVKFQQGNIGLITSGDNAGSLGKIEDIKDGLFSLPKRAILTLGDRSVELPADMVMAVGIETPSIKVN
jgi:small subunit ribosomal protein S4e